MRLLLALAAALAAPFPALAQTTAADILSALEGESDELKQLTAILDGADEEKALTAMRLMLASGDPAMERLALRSGLSSTSGVARAVALEAYLNAAPTLVAFVEHQGENPAGFQKWMAGVGSLSGETTGNFPVPVGPAIEGQACFGLPHAPTTCSVRLGGTEVGFLVGGAWGSARLNENGELVGSISYSRTSTTTGPIKVTIPLLGQLGQ